MLTVRVGCNIHFECESSATVILLVNPRSDPDRPIRQENLDFGRATKFESFVDTDGNIAYRIILGQGLNEIRHDAMVEVSTAFDKSEQFGTDWVHNNIEYRFASGRPDISAAQIIERGYGVCRDFAHCTIALCRAINIPARYVTGHLPDIGHVDPGSPMDFHAYSEVYLGAQWHVFDARYNEPRIGRIKIAQGLDAVECAFATVYGPAQMTKFEVWAYQVDPLEVSLGDPIDLSKRLDGTDEIKS